MADKSYLVRIKFNGLIPVLHFYGPTKPIKLSLDTIETIIRGVGVHNVEFLDETPECYQTGAKTMPVAPKKEKVAIVKEEAPRPAKVVKQSEVVTKVEEVVTTPDIVEEAVQPEPKKAPAKKATPKKTAPKKEEVVVEEEAPKKRARGTKAKKSE